MIVRAVGDEQRARGRCEHIFERVSLFHPIVCVREIPLTDSSVAAAAWHSFPENFRLQYGRNVTQSRLCCQTKNCFYKTGENVSKLVNHWEIVTSSCEMLGECGSFIFGGKFMSKCLRLLVFVFVKVSTRQRKLKTVGLESCSMVLPYKLPHS